MRSQGSWMSRLLVMGLPVGIISLAVAGCPAAQNPASQPTTVATGASPATTTPVTPEGPPVMPAQHKLWVQDSTGANRADCLICHSQAGTPFNYLGASAAATSSFDMVPAPTAMAAYGAANCIGCHKVGDEAVPAPIGLVAANATGYTISIDNFGSEAIWSKATASVVPLFGVWDPSNLADPKADVDVTLWAAYDAGYLYIKAFVPDATRNVEKSPWIKQANGTWKKSATYGDAFNRDDKLVFLWQVYNTSHAALTPEFSTKGCAVTCHDNAGTEGTKPNMYTRAAGQYLDAWRGDLVNILPLKVVMDGYLDNTSSVHSQAGVASMDSKTVATVSVTSAGTKYDVPKYEFPDQRDVQHEGTTFFTLGQTIPATDSARANYVTGSRIPSLITQTTTGAVAQTQAYGQYGNGGWTYVFKRPLTTSDATGDVQFNDLTKSYDFAIGAMNGTNVGHGIQRGINTLTFQP